MKKGVSPIIATALLIVMTISMALLIYIWAMGLVRDVVQKNGQNVDKVCEQLSFDLEVSHEGGNLYDLYITNSGNVPIYAVDIKKIGKGRAVVDRRSISLIEGNSSKEVVSLERTMYQSIFVSPVILGNLKGTQDTRPYSCPQEYGKLRELPF